MKNFKSISSQYQTNLVNEVLISASKCYTLRCLIITHDDKFYDQHINITIVKINDKYINAATRSVYDDTLSRTLNLDVPLVSLFLRRFSTMPYYYLLIVEHEKSGIIFQQFLAWTRLEKHQF